VNKTNVRSTDDSVDVDNAVMSIAREKEYYYDNQPSILMEAPTLRDDPEETTLRLPTDLNAFLEAMKDPP